jgi:hypothetical protein
VVPSFEQWAVEKLGGAGRTRFLGPDATNQNEICWSAGLV